MRWFQPSASRENLKGADGSSSWGRGSQVLSCSRGPWGESIISTCLQGVACVWEAGPQRDKEGGEVAGSHKGRWSVSCLHCSWPESSGISPEPTLQCLEAAMPVVGPVIEPGHPWPLGRGGMLGLSPRVTPDTPSWGAPQSVAQPMKVDQQQWTLTPKGAWGQLSTKSTALSSQQDFPSGPVVRNLPCNAGDIGSVPDWGTNFPHAAREAIKPAHHNYWTCWNLHASTKWFILNSYLFLNK